MIYVDNERKIVSVCYLEGYKSRTDVIPFDKMIAKADKMASKFFLVVGLEEEVFY